MANFFLIIFLFSLLYLAVGIIKPSWVIRWGTPEIKTRKKVIFTGIPLLIVSFICFGFLTETVKKPTTSSYTESTTQESSPQTQNKQATSPPIQEQSTVVEVKETPPTSAPAVSTAPATLPAPSVPVISTTPITTSPQNSKAEKPAIQYKINEKDVPKADPNAWKPGSKRQVTYKIEVPEEITNEQVQEVANYLLEKDAKPLKNWNVAVFWFYTEKTKDFAAFVRGIYTKNGNIPDGNQIKPGQYNDFSWKWDFYR